MSQSGKGLEVDRPSSILPKGSQTAFDNVSTSVERHEATSHSAGAHSYPPCTSAVPSAPLPLPPAPPCHHSTNTQAPSSQQIYHLHFHHIVHPNLPAFDPGVHPDPSPSRSSDYPETSRHPPLSFINRLAQGFTGSQSSPSSHQNDFGRRVAPTNYNSSTQDSQRTLVDTPRYRSLRPAEDSTKFEPTTNRPQELNSKAKQHSRNKPVELLGKSSTLFAMSEPLADSSSLVFRRSQANIGSERTLSSRREGPSSWDSTSFSFPFSVASGLPTRQSHIFAAEKSRTITSRSIRIAQNDQDPRPRPFVQDAPPTSFRRRQFIGHVGLCLFSFRLCFQPLDRRSARHRLGCCSSFKPR